MQCDVRNVLPKYRGGDCGDVKSRRTSNHLENLEYLE
jgi:hypothetical protein